MGTCWRVRVCALRLAVWNLEFGAWHLLGLHVLRLCPHLKLHADGRPVPRPLVVYARRQLNLGAGGGEGGVLGGVGGGGGGENLKEYTAPPGKRLTFHSSWWFSGSYLVLPVRTDGVTSAGVKELRGGVWGLGVGGWRLAVGGWRLGVGGWGLGVGFTGVAGQGNLDDDVEGEECGVELSLELDVDLLGVWGLGLGVWGLGFEVWVHLETRAAVLFDYGRHLERG